VLITLVRAAAAAYLPAKTSSAHASRRSIIALSPLLLGPRPATAASGPSVDILSSPSICQGRCREQDFVVVRYVGRRADGTPFDTRYAETPLIYELGGFYLPGVDKALEGSCVGSRLRLSWASSPPVGDEAKLPTGTPIELELELLTIRYSLFGEKMRDASNRYWFTEQPLTLTSAADYTRGHATSRIPEIKKDNPFSIAPGENSIISNPTSMLTPLFSGFRDSNK
jgi:hypothetical protein